MLRQITKDHPDIFEKILNICSISDNDIERLRNNDSIEVLRKSNFFRVMKS